MIAISFSLLNIFSLNSFNFSSSIMSFSALNSGNILLISGSSFWILNLNSFSLTLLLISGSSFSIIIFL